MAKCAVCGQSGYWVGYSAEHGEDRCVNHRGHDDLGVCHFEDCPYLVQPGKPDCGNHEEWMT